MKFKLGSILFVLAILGAVALAGCTTITNNNGSSGNTTSTGALATSAATTVPTASITPVIDLTNVHWYEYRSSTASVTETGRWDYNVNYNGQNADKLTGTANNPQTGMSGNAVEYLDRADHKKLLGGNYVVMKNGKVTYQGELTPKSDATQFSLDLTNATYSEPHVLTNLGTETVTVPAGTFTTTKYLYIGDLYNSTYYMAPNVPIFVKQESVTSSGAKSVVELMGWG